jgi:molybdate transport system substrate-binding protein
MRATICLLLSVWLLLSCAPPESRLTIAAASDLKFAMDDIAADFRAAHPDAALEIVYGSSGLFHTQIQQGAPYDLFFSADIAFPRELVDKGLAASAAIPYALGRIVLWSAVTDASLLSLDSLASPAIGRVAIANPLHAPYGQRAVEALMAAGVWEAVERKLIYGENIAQTAQFVETGNAEVGIIALALALSPDLRRQGGYALIPADLHAPLEQGYVLAARARDNPLALRFMRHMETPAARGIMVRYGFVLPDGGAADGPHPHAE